MIEKAKGRLEQTPLSFRCRNTSIQYSFARFGSLAFLRLPLSVMKKRHSKKKTTSATLEINKIACLLVTLVLCSSSFAHYIVNPFGLSASTMLSVSLTSIGASALPLVVSSVPYLKKK